MSQTPASAYLCDPYLDWANAQGVPIVEDFGIDIRKVPVAPWPRYGMNGALCHLKGRDDWITIFAFEIKPGGKSERLHHLYEDVIYVISGHGSTVVEVDGRKHTFEWGPKSIFSVPLNATYQHFNGSGREPARLACTNNMVYVMKRFRDERFIFESDARFPERTGDAKYFGGDGEFIGIRPGRHQWETNFVPDLSSFELKTWAARGAGGSHLRFMLADNTIGAHSSEMPVGTYKKGHRHFDGVCVFAVTGQGFSLLWYEGQQDFTRIDWEHGVVYCPPDMMYHQHFNVSNFPSRYLALQMGTIRYPLTEAKRLIWDKGVDLSVKLGGAQVEYEDQDPRIHAIWLKEIAKNGVESKMGEFPSTNRSTRQRPEEAEMTDIVAPAPAGKYMVDTYENWMRAEGIPIHQAFALDLPALDTRPWPRMGVNGAFCHLKGRCDYLSMWLLDIPGGGTTEPQRHLFEAVFHVVSGRGSAAIETADGTTHTFEFGPRSLFAVPMNARYRLFNAAGAERVRVAVVSDFRYLLNLFRNEDFLLANPARFPDREGAARHFTGDGDFRALRPGRHAWETNFVPDVADFELREWAERGAGATSLRFLLAESMLGVHASELPVGTYKKAHRHLPGYIIFAVTGTGYTLHWFEGDAERERIDWRPGMVYAPGLQMFHQHFNTGKAPARYLAVQYGSIRYPMVREKALTYDKGADTAIGDGGGQIEYADQDPRIHAQFLAELKRTGVQPKMEPFVKA